MRCGRGQQQEWPTAVGGVFDRHHAIAHLPRFHLTEDLVDRSAGLAAHLPRSASAPAFAERSARAQERNRQRLLQHSKRR